MITVGNIGYNGRLGNQLFQFAVAFSLGIEHQQHVRFRRQSVENAINGCRCELLDLFSLDEYFIDERLIPQTRVYHEPRFSYSPIPVEGDVNLHGYFQSEKYFEKNSAALRKALVFRQSHLDAISSLQALNVVASLHVRRGDYVPQPHNHPPCTPEYYRVALDCIPDGNVLVFSDDIEWCLATFTVQFCPGKTFIFAQGNTYTDFCAMAHCPHNIISNSTFSWWAAWLNENPEKIVVAPSNWFGPALAHNDTKDLIPTSWILR